jgi:pimeloyl-ACP methyl ester carboxylesterase
MDAIAVRSASIPGFDDKSTIVAGIRLHYWIGGDPNGQPVILWHGFLSTGFAWRNVAPALAKPKFLGQSGRHWAKSSCESTTWSAYSLRSM